jgi:hypothetical protein
MTLGGHTVHVKVFPFPEPITTNCKNLPWATPSELYVNWKANSGGGIEASSGPVHFSFSKLWAEILNTERCAVYETEAIEKRHLV